MGEVLRDGIAQCLFMGRAEADPGLEDLTRGLAAAEPREADLLGDGPECAIDVVIELGFFHFDVQLDLVPLEGFERLFTGRRVYRRDPARSTGQTGPESRGGTRDANVPRGPLAGQNDRR